jgi:hypothetical protein
MTPQQPELRRSGRSAVMPDAPPPDRPDPEQPEKRGPIPAANRPGHHPAREQDKPQPERVASTLHTRPADQLAARRDAAERKTLPEPLRKLAFGIGAAAGLGATLAETAWDAAKGAYERGRDR